MISFGFFHLGMILSFVFLLIRLRRNRQIVNILHKGPLDLGHRNKILQVVHIFF